MIKKMTQRRYINSDLIIYNFRTVVLNLMFVLNSCNNKLYNNIMYYITIIYKMEPIVYCS